MCRYVCYGGEKDSNKGGKKMWRDKIHEGCEGMAPHTNRKGGAMPSHPTTRF